MQARGAKLDCTMHTGTSLVRPTKTDPPHLRICGGAAVVLRDQRDVLTLFHLDASFFHMPRSFSADVVGCATTFMPLWLNIISSDNGPPICDFDTIHGMIEGVRV